MNDDDSPVIHGVLSNVLADLKDALRQFIREAEKLVRTWCQSETPCVSPLDVGALLERLDHDILPNITPDATLLGKRAAFAAILSASALFRLQILTATSPEELRQPRKKEDLSRRTALVERLTAKALEVTFIQQEFEKRKKA